MAERRMFAKTIIDSDAFLDMPVSTQLLYFHLCMRADDDGFINSAKKIQRMIGASDDDLKLLMAKRFVLPFESGIIVIKHWRIHNYIQSDRYIETKYLEEKSLLGIKENKAYTFLSDGEDCVPLPIGVKNKKDKRLNGALRVYDVSGNVSASDTECIHGVYTSETMDTMDTQVRLGKVSIDNSKSNSNNTEREYIARSDEDDLSFVSPVSTGSTRKKTEKTDDSPVVCQLMLNDKSMYDIHQSMIDEYASLYPAVNIEQELRNMIGWIDSNPNKRKTRTGIKRFINAWLAREQNRGGTGRIITSADQAFRIGKTGQRMTLEQDHTLDGIL